MANYREEHIRNNRRLARQVVGAAALLLALIGLFTVLGWIVGLVRAALDDTDLRNEYRDRLYGMVMLDPVAFDDVNSVDEGVFKQAAIWGTVYQVQNSGGSLDQYERDPDTGSALIPALEIDTYISNLLGPDYQVTEGTFSTAEFVYQYDEEKQAYLVPVTSSVALYTPTVEKITKKDGQRIVTVGYVPTSSNNATGELSLTAPTEPTKYMDYVFTRGENRQWYLTALRDSDMQVEVTPIPAPTDAVVDNMQNEEMGTSDASSTEPAPVPAVPVVPPMPEWEFLKTLPFIVRQGLSTGHADMLGIGVEAVFFPAEAVNRLDDPVLRLVPFLPADEGELLCRESDRRTFQAGGLYAQPDAVIALRAGGVLAVEYKSRGGRMDDPHDIPGSLRPKDLLQTVIGAMVLSASEGVACAPVLRTNNAVYFLRPGKTLATLLAERIGAAVSFVKPYAERSGISASDYAELCVVPAQMLSGRPVRSEGDLRGEAAHALMLR